jgi:hypothetical protein
MKFRIADKTNKKVVAYCLWAGNPYGDPWDVEIVGDGLKSYRKWVVSFPILLVILL